MNQSIAFSSNAAINSESARFSEHGRSALHFASTTDMKQNSVFALARAFLSISSMTHKKLQKLCFYAKAWYLALYGENLIDEQFEAWVHGAVQPELYRRYRTYGFSDIPKESDTSTIPEEFLSFAKEVYEAYGHLTGDELERINHSEKPWQNARGNCRPWESCRNVISEDDMQCYYREKLL